MSEQEPSTDIQSVFGDLSEDARSQVIEFMEKNNFGMDLQIVRDLIQEVAGAEQTGSLRLANIGKVRNIYEIK